MIKTIFSFFDCVGTRPRYCTAVNLTWEHVSSDWDNGFILQYNEHLWTKSLEVATFRRSSKWWSTPVPRSLLGRSFAYDTSTPEEPSATGSTCFRTGSQLGGFDHSPWLWSAKCVYDLGYFKLFEAHLNSSSPDAQHRLSILSALVYVPSFRKRIR